MCFKKSKVYDAKIVPLKDLLLKGNKYRIPEYQRPYAWEEKHWEDLWNDLQRACEKGSEYLLGSVYLNEDDEILDGQQRLVTLYMLLKHLDFNNICDIELGGNDREIFEKIKNNENINNDDIKTTSQRRLNECKEFFQEKDKEEKICQNFKNFIQNKVFFIETRIDDSDKTNSIITFITQTDRGKRLSNLEKIKSNLYYASYILSLNKKTEIDEIFSKCYQYINTLYDKPEKGERMIVSALYGLLRYMNIKNNSDKTLKDIGIDTKIIETPIYKEYILKDIYLLESEDTITERINNALSVSKDSNFLDIVLKLLEKIKEFLKDYSQTRNENEIFHNELNLNRYILVAMILGKYDTGDNNNLELDEKQLNDKKIDITQWEDNKKEFEFLLSKEMLLGKWNQKLIERSHFAVFSAGKSPYSTFLQNPIGITKDYKYDKLYIFDSIVWGNYRYILLAYEEFYRAKNNLPKLDYLKVARDKIEREHLFSQKPQDNNIKDQVRKSLPNKDEYVSWIWNIGNILLLPKVENISIGNGNPLEKANKIFKHFIAEKYKNDERQFPFQSTIAFLKKIKECQNVDKMVKLCNERTEKLKCFVWHRF